MPYFHYRCGERITLTNDNYTAIRNDSDFDHGIVIGAEPLVNDVLFEIKIDRKVTSWSGSLEIGVLETDPLNFEFPPCASKIQKGSWIMTGNSILKDGCLVMERYEVDLDKLNLDDRVGVMRTSEGDLIIYINGESQGVAAKRIPPVMYPLVDLYGKCVQVTITSPNYQEHNNDDCLSGSSILAIENDNLNVTLGADLSELSLSSNNSLDIRMDMNMGVPEPTLTRHDKLRFHERCGSLVKLSNGQRTAERRRPLDEFNNGVVMTHRPLFDGELFEIRIDQLVDKWSGSIEMGITTHNPGTLVFPATMTNMRSGTIMMSGCGILTNGKGTKREYGDFNLDELNKGDRVGMMRKPEGSLHYFINGLDQGVAAQHVPSTVWGVIDLYGMTIKVSIVERDEREEQNLMTRRNTRDQQLLVPETHLLPDFYDRLTFHGNCGSHAQVINNGRTAHRPNAADDFNNGVVLTSRALRPGELFEVRLDRIVTKWAGSIEIGVTTHSPMELEFPFTMTNMRSGTWMMTGSGIMHNGTTISEQYGVNLDRLQVGDRVGVVRKDNGMLHFYVNGFDQGVAASNVPEKIFGVIDLYGQAVEATIVDMYSYGSSDTLNSTVSNTTLYSDMKFHHVHGKNVRIVNNGRTALRPRPLAEFNDAIVFSSRPLRDGELFEICLDTMVDRWSGSIELGVTAVKPDDVDLPGTATDLCGDTWMLSGSSVMENGSTIRNNYPCDLDTLTAGIRLGVLRNPDKTLEFYRDGVPQGVACLLPRGNVYAVVDLYGQCAQVSIPYEAPAVPPLLDGCCPRSETSAASVQTNLHQGGGEAAAGLHRFSECHGKNVTLTDGGRVAVRCGGHGCAVVYSAASLSAEEMFEVAIHSLQSQFSGTVAVGVTGTEPVPMAAALPVNCCYITGNELRLKNQLIQHFSPSLEWLGIGDRIGFLQTHEGIVKVYINGEDINLHLPTLPGNLHVVAELRGNCSGISMSSRKAPPSPMGSLRMQDSLELLLVHEQPPTPSVVTEVSERVDEIAYSFHDNHGRNVEISADRLVAKRVASYNQGIVLVQPALAINGVLQVEVEQLDTRWQSSLMVGVVLVSPDRLSLPVKAGAFKSPSRVIAHDFVSCNGHKVNSTYGEKLNDLRTGSRVGLRLTDMGYLQLIVDGVAEVPPIASLSVNSETAYAFFDLYGQCQQIKILNGDGLATPTGAVASKVADYEKADLESGEKDSNLSATPVACTSVALASGGEPQHPVDGHVSLECAYRQEIVGFKRQLMLPDEFFVGEDDCYCIVCYKLKGQDAETFKDESIIGWVKFPLRNLMNVQTEKWHTAYYGTKLGAIRRILDKGQPLTRDEAQWCSFASIGGEDVQIVFHPSLQHCEAVTFKIETNKGVQAAFQLLVKPGAYSVSKDSTEWSTKETGALVLHSLLLKFVD